MCWKMNITSIFLKVDGNATKNFNDSCKSFIDSWIMVFTTTIICIIWYINLLIELNLLIVIKLIAITISFTNLLTTKT
jgi:hypothetical protein